jgi:hypothetical protein
MAEDKKAPKGMRRNPFLTTKHLKKELDSKKQDRSSESGKSKSGNQPQSNGESNGE